MKKRKVLFITPSLCQGGIEHFQISMLTMLDEEKFDITLFLYLDDVTLLPLVPNYVKVVIDQDKNHYFRSLRAIKLTLLKKVCFMLGLKKSCNKYSELLRDYIHDRKMKHPAQDLFFDEHFDVVVSNVVGKATEMALHISAKKRYAFFHSSLDMHHELLARLFPQYDGIVAVSQGVKDMLQKAYPAVKDKVLLLENYVDAETILQKAAKENSEYKVENNNGIYTIGSCGRLSSEKGFDLAVEAAAVLKQKGYAFKWYFIGDGPERHKIEEKLSKYSLEDEICITGFVDNPFSIMKQCDIYVQPSYEESYGRTIKEAIILGCPVVSTSTVGGNTLIKDRENGVLTEINKEELANGIIEMIENTELQKKCRESYSLEQNLYEKKVFKDNLEKLLS